jgi:MOSC domain-containing protein
MRITAIYTHPVKGAHRLEHDSVAVDPWGLAGDRRWMLVDDDGVGITQRDDPRLTLLRVRQKPGGLALSAPDLPDLDVPEPVDAPEEHVRVFSSQDKVPARIAESSWVTAYLGRPARLAWQADPTGREVQGPSLPGDVTNLADGYPVLLANTGSLDAVNDWLAEAGEEPVPMTRFRPNLVVDGAPAWAEDGWLGRRLQVGEVSFRAATACARCLVTTIDQETGERASQPLKILGRHRRYDEGLLFAINLIPDAPYGVVRVGDPVVLGLS